MGESGKQIKEGAKIFGDRFVLRVSRDKLQASLVAKDGMGMKAVDFPAVIKEVRANGVVFGLLDNPELTADEDTFIVARGLEPEKGEPSVFKMHVRAANVRTPKVRDPSRDRVDYRELGSIVNVTAELLLMEKIPATPGIPGKNVLGVELPPKPGKDIKLKLGPGVKFSEDELQVYSLLDGKFMLVDGNKPAVYSEHTVTGDIDMSIGNVVFGGTALSINGEVLPGFQVKCRGDVKIGGTINNALVMAGGFIDIDGSVVGDEARVKAGGDISISFVENGPKISCNGNLNIQEYIVQSQCKVGKDLHAREKGTIIGGKLLVGGSIFVNDLGSEAEVATDISVGMNLTLQAKKEKLDEELPLWSGRLNELIKNMSGLQKMKKDQGKDFPPERVEKLKKYSAVMPKLMNKVDRLNEIENEIQAEMDKMVDECIYVYGSLYPGVTVRIGTAVRTISLQEDSVVVHFDRTSRMIHVRNMTREEIAARHA